MTRIQGMGSNRSTNRPNGGGPKKQGIPSKIGRPANLMRFVSINSTPGLPSAPSGPIVPSCITYAPALINASIVGSLLLVFYGSDGANSGFDFSLVAIGWKIYGSSSFGGTIESVTYDPTGSKILQCTLASSYTGLFPASGNVILTNC